MIRIRTAVRKFNLENGAHRGTRSGYYLRVSTLKERIEMVLSMNRFKSNLAWSRAANLGDSVVEKLRKRETANQGNVELSTLVALADAAGVSRVWFVLGLGEPTTPLAVAPTETTMSAGTFLLKLKKQPALEREIEAFPGRWKVGTIARALDLQLEHDAGGRPAGGWPKILDDIQSGQYDIPHQRGVEEATERQVGKRPSIPRRR